MEKDHLSKARIILEDSLDKFKMRKTIERYKILDEIYGRNDHFEADDLFIDLKTKKFHVSKATVYNTLEFFVEIGLVTKHQFGFSNAFLYEKAFGRKQHSHTVCIKCQKVEEFCDPRLQNIKQNLETFSQMNILDHSLIFYGVCKNCRSLDEE